MDNNKDNPSIEETFEELNELILRLQNKDTGLKESFALYAEGMKKIQICNEEMDKIEKEIEILNSED